MNRDLLITAPANSMTPADFLDAMFGPGRMEEIRREVMESCIRAIQRGNTYGFPPLLVAECREIIANQEKLTEVEILEPVKGRHRVAA